MLTKPRDVIASATDMCIVYHVTLVEASRNVNLGTRYDSRCVGAECGTRNMSFMRIGYILLTRTYT